jgi:hypothetical protein
LVEVGGYHTDTIALLEDWGEGGGSRIAH